MKFPLLEKLIGREVALTSELFKGHLIVLLLSTFVHERVFVVWYYL